MVFLILVGLVTLFGIIYLAVSRHSSFPVRIAAIGAVALMIITVIACLVIFFRGGTPKMMVLPDTLPSDIPPESEQSNIFMVAMSIVFLIVLFALVVVLSMREHRRVEDGKEDEGFSKRGW